MTSPKTPHPMLAAACSLLTFALMFHFRIVMACLTILLPNASLRAQASATETVHVAIAASWISCEAKRVAATQPLAADARDVPIEPLVERLAARVAAWVRLHPSQPYPGTVMLEVDAAVTQRVVRKVLLSIMQSGFTRVSFARSGVMLALNRDQASMPSLAILWIKPDGHVLASGELVSIDKKAHAYDLPGLQQRLRALRKLQSAQGRMFVAPDDEIPFGAVSDAMAAAIAAGYPDLEFMPGGPPSILLSKTAPRGSLSKSVIQGAIDKEHAAIRACYEQYVARQAGASAALSGRIIMKFVIAESGRVGVAAVEETTFDDDALLPCMVGAIKHVTFPPPDGGGVVVVSYPFRFGPSE